MITAEIEQEGEAILSRINEEIQIISGDSYSLGILFIMHEDFEMPDLLGRQTAKKIAVKWKSWMDYWDIHGSPTARHTPTRAGGIVAAKTVPGIAIPESLYTRVLVQNNEKHGILQSFVLQDMPPKYLKWLLAAGFNPNWYDGLVTAVGAAAYSGNLKALDIFWRWGADLELKLEDEQSNKTSTAGSTLLLRVMSRSIPADKKIPIARYLAEKAKLPIEPTQSGRTIFDVNDKTVLAVVQEVLARREEAVLHDASASGGRAFYAAKRI